MAGSDRSEVTFIESGQFLLVEPLHHGEHRSVHEPEVAVPVLVA